MEVPDGLCKEVRYGEDGGASAAWNTSLLSVLAWCWVCTNQKHAQLIQTQTYEAWSGPVRDIAATRLYHSHASPQLYSGSCHFVCHAFFNCSHSPCL
jgi:hypothetical protein